MRRVINTVRSPGFVRALLIGTVGLAAAGCSSEVTRFSQPLFGSSSETRYTGTVTPNPVAGVERQQLDAPGGESAYPAIAGGGTNGAGGANVVTAQAGDTAYSVARRYGIPHTALMQANGMSDPTAVRPGQQLIIPTYSQGTGSWQAQQSAPPLGGGQVAAQPSTQPRQPEAARQSSGGAHRVGHGETVYSIARAYNVGPTEIIRANGLNSPDNIRVGQSLTIPGASGASSAPQQVAAVAPPPSPAPQPSQTAPQQQANQTPSAEAPKPVPASFTTGEKEANGTDTRAGVADPAPLSAGTFRWPVRGRVISAFGDTSNGSRNDGVNIAVPEGTSVRAAENGVVAYAGDELKGYGNLVLIRHSDDWVTAYAHNSEINVRRGDQVTRGQVIGKAGQSGSVSSPQLHFELRKGSQPVDPLRYLAEN